MYSNSCDYKIYYEITGNPKGEWLLLFHGISASTKCWKYQINELNKYFRVLNLDLAGHGKSEPLKTERYSGGIIANHIRILLDELNINKVNILGISLGTIIQQYFCEMFPERVISNVLTSPITKSNYISVIMNSFVKEIIFKILSKNAYFYIITHLSLPGKIHKVSRSYMINESKKMPNHELLKWWQLILRDDTFNYISKSKIPTLIIVGDKDYCYYKDAYALKNKYVNSDIKEINNVGHVLIFQKPEEFNNIVIDFLSQYKANNIRIQKSS